jgi:hypothetical protein
MTLSRLVLAAIISLRAVLIYGEAQGAGAAQLSWRDLLPARLRAPRSAPAHVARARRYA